MVDSTQFGLDRESGVPLGVQLAEKLRQHVEKGG